MKRVPLGGSSRSLRRAFAASGLASWGTRFSASPMMKNCSFAIMGRLWAALRIARMAAR